MGKRESERDVSSNDVQLVCDALQLNRSNEANGGNTLFLLRTLWDTNIITILQGVFYLSRK